ncbi:helix-turn-helix domain-containing protein [Variovorax sp. Varisp41]|uniref:helix-turn-helix domain-containing protein n=1 Tax=Variovorax sp. Varisp41 TaxID=3243033 RepID=UPI0039B66215
MSNEAINWALGQPVSKSSAKFVLVAMANLAGADMTCWPSYKHLTSATAQDIKTVQAGLRRLRDDGYITDTGERKGSTGQVIVYRLNTPEFGGVRPMEKTPEIPSKSPENGVVSVAPKTPVFPVKTPVFPTQDPQISHETPPKTGVGTIKDTSRTPKEPKEESADFFGGPFTDVDPKVLADFRKLRTKLKAPLTDTAVAGLVREAKKAGMTLTDVMRMCCERSWRGFNAEWVASGGKQDRSNQPSRHTGFDQRNYEGEPDGSIPA